jgi:phosphoribosylaminoimidazole-succinocarboxamide synthase
MADAIHNRDDFFNQDRFRKVNSMFWESRKYAAAKCSTFLRRSTGTRLPPGPRLPKDVIEKTSAKYREAFRRLTNRKIA